MSRKNPDAFYTYHRVNDLAKATRCQIINVDKESYKVTIYLPKYDIEKTMEADIDYLELYGIYHYPNSRSNQSFDEKIKELHGHRKIAIIDRLIHGDVYSYITIKYLDNNRQETIPVSYLKAFSGECPNLERPADQIKIDGSLIGKKIAVELHNDRPIHCLLLTEDLERILS